MAKNSPEWQKILSVILHISGTIHHMIVIYVAHVWNDNISRLLFHFSKILIFCIARWVKRQKMVQNNKKFCPSPFIYQELYIIWLSFMEHMCKVIISPVVFFSFSKFRFFGLLGGLKDKKWSKMIRDSVCCISYFRNHTSCDCQLWYAFVK